MTLKSSLHQDIISTWCRENGVREDAFYNAVFSFVLAKFNGENIDGEESTKEYVRTAEAQIAGTRSFPLTLDEENGTLKVTVFMEDGRVVFQGDDDKGICSEAYMHSFIDAMEQAAAGFMEQESLKDVNILSASAASVIAAFNDTGYDVPFVPCHQLFETQVHDHPDRPALIARDAVLTYAELNERANRIAHALIARGLRIGETVGMLLPRVADAIAAEYGIMKAGGAFLPMLPDYPDERIDYCMTDSGSRFLLTTKEIIRERTDLFAGKAYEALDISCMAEDGKTGNPELDIPSDSPVYCIYTSGSTGRPKGVIIGHGNLCNFVSANPKNHECFHFVHAGENPCGQGDAAPARTALSVAALSFDFSLMEIHLTLMNGMTLCLADEEAILNPLALAKLIETHRVEVFSGTPSFLSNLLDIPEAAAGLRGIKMYDLGAETFPPALYERIRGASPDALIVNGYGPTEATISCISKVIEGPENITIGKPAANVKAWIMDSFGHILPLFARGELVIGGAGVGQGYVNLPEKTAAVFIDVEGQRAYKTGDMARINGDGEIEFLGRTDNQVKLHGLRIELDEIENVIATYPGVQNCVVIVRENEAGETYLCAYFTAARPVETDDLKAHIAKSLARYMVPAAFMQLDKIPLTSNGKADRKALPEPVLQLEEYELPHNDTQQKIFDCAAEAVGHRHFGITTDIYDAGLTSLGAIRLTVLLFKAFGVPVTVRDLMENETIEKLESFLTCSSPEEETFDLQSEYSLMKSQEGVFFDTMSNPDTTIYNLPFLIILPEGTDIPRLREALAAVVNAHPYIMTRLFINGEGKIMARRKEGEVFTVGEIEETTCGNIEEVKNDLVKPYNLTGDRLFRIQLIHAEREYLFVDFHHVICDGTSLTIFFDDVTAAYNGQGIIPEQYSGYEAALVEEKRRQSPQYEEAKRYYTDLFSGIETDSMPIPDAEADEQESTGTLMLPAVHADQEKIARFCREIGITENAFYTAAFGYVLSIFSGENRIVFPTVHNGRVDPRFENTISMFVHTIPVLCRTENRKVSEYLSEVGKQLLDSINHDLYSFGEISHDLGIQPKLLFVWQGALEEDRILGELMQTVPVTLDAAKADIEIQVIPSESGLNCAVTWRKERYSEEMIRTLTSVYDIVLEEMTLRDELKDIHLADGHMLETMNHLNDTERNWEKADIVSKFRSTAGKVPERPAVIFGEKTYTYAQLDEITDRLAGSLHTRGIGRGDVVSILITRSEYMPVASLGVLKSCAAYQPLDPSYPTERLTFMIKDADCKLLIADEQLLEKVPEYKGPVLLTKDIPGLPAGEPLKDCPSPDDLFILLYTSGSTGTPKGVMLTHGNLCNFCNWYREYYTLDENCRVSAYASYGFDANMMDMYPALTTGACVCIIEEEIRLDLPAMEAWFNRLGITHAFMTTQVGRQFYSLISIDSLRYLSVGGEKLVPIPPRESGTKLVNAYGPTECTIYTTAMPVERMYERVPIGKPLSNCKCYVVDEFMRRLPPLVPGELLISGRGVAKGYLNRPDLTEKAFISNPFSDEPDYARVYRSGDVVRLLPDGSIDFIGRNDGQVKVRGFRIELTEVEGVIREYPGIKDATVQTFEDEKTGEKFIAAYVVSDSEIDTSALDAFIASRKPAYMVPAVTMQIDVIPLNQNQKVNRRALPKPEPKKRAGAEAGAPAAPLNLLEQALKQIVSEIVGMTEFGIMDRFADIGLSSISAIRLAVQLYKQYGVQLNARDLVADGTLQSVENEILAALLGHAGEQAASGEEAAAEGGDGRNSEDRQQGAAPAGDADSAPRACRLSFAQQGVYAECQAHPEAVTYNLPFVLKFPDGTSEEQLRDAILQVIEAHPYILCRFSSDENSEIIQEPIPDYTPEIPVLNMTPAELETHKAAFVRPFDLEKGPVVRFEIIRADALYLLADMHHLVSDGASMDIFFTQLCAALDGEAPEREQYDYYDYVAGEEISREAEEFFEARMAGAEEATQLIPDVFEENLPHTEMNTVVPTDFARVKEFARQNGITPAAVYLAAAVLAYGRYVCEDTVAIATISNGRSNLRIADTIGMFVNTLPLVIAVDPQEETGTYLRRVAEEFSATIENEHYPFARIAAKYDFHPMASYTYQIGVLDSYHTKYGSVAADSFGEAEAKLPAGIYIVGTEASAMIQVTYDSALYSEEMMHALAESVENAVQGLMTCTTLREISLTGPDQWKILDTYNKPWDLDYNPNDTAVTVFRRNAGACPDKVAAVFRDKTWTYRELDELTDRLAAKLYQRVRELTGDDDPAEQVVSILIPRNENVFILPLAAVKAGLAYEPLDPSYPKERLNFMVKDAGACLLIAEESLRGLVDEYQGAVLTVQELYAMEDGAPVPAGPKPGDLFILLYTSGSTGMPKGCQIEHRNLVSYAHGVRNDFYRADDRIAAYASFGFDVNMSDVFCTLLNGGTVCLVPEEIRMDLDGLAAWFDENRVTALLLTTQVGVQFLQNHPVLSTLRMLVMGGEKLPAVDPSKLSYTIVNGYGPTENCCGVSLFPIRAWEPNIPIGRPMATIHGYILDKTGHRLPAGAAGEYCLSGPQVSRGYLNRPEKTKEAYEQCPFNDFRMYHTGDIVRYRFSGDVEFVGRKDGQVKIRGFRIETREVESVIRGFEGIRDVTVQAYDYAGGGKYLAAFVVSDHEVDTARLAAFIREQKPAYMVPAVIMQIEQVPLTVNQKVDKKALPKPNLQKAEYVAPVGRSEEQFCAIFAKVLGLERVGAEDDFFEAGGNSILAMKMVIAAGNAGYTIAYNDVFKYTTPRVLAGFTGGETKTSGSAAAPVTAPESAGSVPETGPDGYDYRPIHELLSRNTLEAFKEGSRLELDDVLLLGGTGYLGSHVLHELIVNHEGRVYCLVRPNKEMSGEVRLKATLQSYFGSEYAPLLGERIIVIEGDATDPAALNAFKAPKEDLTVINCAASVKHFARGNEIERNNVDSVRNLTAWCEENKARLVHISTCSVMGNRVNNMPPAGSHLDEHMLYNGQETESNQYVHSKYMAERHIYEEILTHGLRAKVLRVGNLAPRAEDGVFQLNSRSNSFMNTFRAYAALGVIPYDEMNEATEFSPIDRLAEAVLALATTPEACVCFMMLNAHRPLNGDIIREMNALGLTVRGAEEAEFAGALEEALKDDLRSEAVSSLIAYRSDDDIEPIGLSGCDTDYTNRVLERLGFNWPETGSAYIRKFLVQLEKKGFFGQTK